MSLPPEAAAAIARLRQLIVGTTQEVETQELMALADQAVAGFDLEKDRKEIADMLIGALSTLRFSVMFGNDAVAARVRIGAILGAIVKATSGPAPPG